MKALRLLLLFIAFTVVNTVVAQTVYTTETGEKYHTSGCRYLKYSKKEYILVKAKALGFEACLVCKPNAENLNTTTAPKTLVSKSETTTPSKKATASQCTGKTQSGSRCKRKTKNANERCYQH